MPDAPGLVNENPGYVGAQACADCHAARCQEFQQTRHAQACCEVQPDRHDSSELNAVVTAQRVPEASFWVTREADRLVEIGKSGSLSKGDHQTSAPLDLAYGYRGNADEIYFSWQGEQLRELPLAWIESERRWAIQPFAQPTSEADFSREATTRCLECHNTWFEHRKGTANRYRRDSFLLGVTCERCHGPAREHVDYHRAHPAETTPHRILQPRQFTRQQKLDLCGQCHTSVVYRRDEVFSYRPGEPLTEHFRQHENKHFEDDHVADQLKYLQQSRCFLESDRLTCTSCHSPHHQTTAAQTGQVACRKCHEPEACHETARLPTEVASQCAACHMPRYSRLAIKFHSAERPYEFPVRPSRHRIAVYPEARDEVLAEYYRQKPQAAPPQALDELTTRLAAHWTKAARECEGEGRPIAAIGAWREAARWDASGESGEQLAAALRLQQEVDQAFFTAMQLMKSGKHQAAADACRSVLELQPNHVEATKKLGTLSAVLGDQPAATRYLERAAELDPDDAYAENMLGWLAYLRNEAAEAAKHFARADAIYPYTAEINFRWALALIRQKKWSEAETHLRQVIEIDPLHEAAFQLLGRVLLEAGKPAAALPYAYRAAELSELRNPDSLTPLADAFAACGRMEDAQATIRHTLEIPGVRGSPLENQLRRRLDEGRDAEEATSDP